MKKFMFISFMVVTRVLGDGPLLALFYFLYIQRSGTGGFTDILFNAAIFVIWAFLHSLLATPKLKNDVARKFGEEYVRGLYVMVSGVTLSVVMYLWRPVRGELWHFVGPMYWVMAIFYLVVIALILYTTLSFDYFGFIGNRAILRKMRHLPPKPAVFSVKGPYAYCRHPMYLLVMLSFWVAPVMSYSRLEFAVLGCIYFLLGTFHEEKNLRRELGEVYDVYRNNVPMWFPRITPWMPDTMGKK